MSERGSVAAFLLIAFAAGVTRIWLGPFVLDDAYITFRYAHHVAEGLGFTYNPPVRILGTTTPLFTLLLTVPAAFHWDLGWSALVIAILSDLVTMACGYRILMRHGWPAAALIYVATLAFWPIYLAASVSGMETSLYVALLTLSWLAIDRVKPMTAACALGLAALCRPDGLLACAILLAWIAWRCPRAAWKSILLFAVIVAPWVVFATDYFGSPLPVSITAKAQVRLSAGQSLRVFLQRFGDVKYLPMTLLAVLGGFELVRSRRDVFVAGAAWWLVYASAFVVTGAFSNYPWYFVPLLPAYAAAFGVGLEGLVRRFVKIPARQVAGAIMIVSVAVLWLLRLPHHRDQLREWAAGREELYRSVVAAHLQGSQCTLAASEIGALGYFYDGPVLDLVGLVSPEAIGRPLLDVVAAERPCWLTTYSDHVDQAVLTAPEFRQHYALTFSRAVGPTREFLLFKRVEVP